MSDQIPPTGPISPNDVPTPMDVDEDEDKIRAKQDAEMTEEELGFRYSRVPSITPIDLSSIESEEDRLLAEELFLCLDRLRDSSMAQSALEIIRIRIQEATCTMTSVPKPLKYLRTRLTEMISIYEQLDDEVAYKALLAIVISVVGMTIGPRGICVRYRILSEKSSDLAEWGHEYVKHLSAEISLCSQIPEYYNDLSRDFPDSILLLANLILPYFLDHNCEADAVDLLSSLSITNNLVNACDSLNYRRIALYLLTSAHYLLSDDEGKEFVLVAMRIYSRFLQFSNALICALILRDVDQVLDVLSKAKEAADHKRVDKALPLQLAYILSRHGWPSYQSNQCLPKMAIGDLKQTDMI
ncbi:hypothetical protein ACOME3_005287 [Neoechinorhynchus agilis]